MKLGTLQQHALHFYQWLVLEQGEQAWHSYAKDALTVRVIQSLVKRGQLEINQYHQARYINH